MDATLAARVRAALRAIADHPKPGILFQDITPVLADAALFADAIDGMAAPFRDAGITRVVGIEARGFFFGAPLAIALGAGFAPVRKPGKLPWKALQERYALEYGEDALEVHHDACGPDDTVLIVDDVLATGGTAEATARLVHRLGGRLAGWSFLLAIPGLGGAARLEAMGRGRIASVVT